MRKFFLCFTALLLSLDAFGKTLIPIVTDSSYPPYSYQDDSAKKGIYIEIVEALNETMPDFAIKLRPMPWPQAMNKVRNGEVPAILGAYYHGHDWDYLYPYSQPLYYEDVILLCHKDKVSQSNLTWPQDLAGKLVSNISGYDGWLNNNVRAKSVTDIVNFIEVPNITTAWQMVNRKIVDCTLFEKRAMEAMQESLGQMQNLNIASQIAKESVHIGFGNHSAIKQKWPQIEAFQKQLDNAIYLTKKQTAKSVAK